MITLYDSAFSPFARKVRMVLEHKDLQRARDVMSAVAGKDLERRKIFWRGDRIEWMLVRGFHDWFHNEIREDRVLWPGPSLPAPLSMKENT